LSKFILIAILCAALFAAGCVTKPEGSILAEHACAACHSKAISHIEASGHGMLDCADCHGLLENHLRVSGVRPTIKLNSEICISCHEEEHREWLLSPHGQISTLFYPNSLSKMKKSTHPDFPKPSRGESEQVTCVYCHNFGNPEDTQLVRLPKGELCFACHDTLWQNQVLTGTPAHPYPGHDYSALQNHPHNQGDRCITCHMYTNYSSDEPIGGHTLAMRGHENGLLNLAACATCHGPQESYDVNGRQADVRQALDNLRVALEKRNNGALPESAEGSCNQCKRGSMQPFDYDPDLILDDAFQNYLQIDRDNSLGVHNPHFALQILQESLESVETLYGK
jgi:predicted CXXCH cytochrome family protein